VVSRSAVPTAPWTSEDGSTRFGGAWRVEYSAVHLIPITCSKMLCLALEIYSKIKLYIVVLLRLFYSPFHFTLDDMAFLETMQ
jgi:hypothetical protein